MLPVLFIYVLLSEFHCFLHSSQTAPRSKQSTGHISQTQLAFRTDHSALIQKQRRKPTLEGNSLQHKRFLCAAEAPTSLENFMPFGSVVTIFIFETFFLSWTIEQTAWCTERLMFSWGLTVGHSHGHWRRQSQMVGQRCSQSDMALLVPVRSTGHLTRTLPFQAASGKMDDGCMEFWDR